MQGADPFLIRNAKRNAMLAKRQQLLRAKQFMSLKAKEKAADYADGIEQRLNMEIKMQIWSFGLVQEIQCIYF